MEDLWNDKWLLKTEITEEKFALTKFCPTKIIQHEGPGSNPGLFEKIILWNYFKYTHGLLDIFLVSEELRFLGLNCATISL
jgi:hypothetical protein